MLKLLSLKQEKIIAINLAEKDLEIHKGFIFYYYFIFQSLKTDPAGLCWSCDTLKD